MEAINLGELLNLLLVLAGAAAVAGFMAGLLGVGGGIIIAREVPTDRCILVTKSKSKTVQSWYHYDSTAYT